MRRSDEIPLIESVYHRPMEGSALVTAFILAGGKSTRMGTDKAFVQYQGATLLARTLAVARSAAAEVRIVGSRQTFAAFAPVVEDVFHSCGPLGGIHAALQSTTTELNLILAVDAPFVSRELLLYLIGGAENAPDAAVIVPHAGGRSQPLCAIYRPEFLGVAETALRAGQNKIDRLFSQVRSRVVSQDELEAAGFSPALFLNLNTPEELSKAY